MMGLTIDELRFYGALAGAVASLVVALFSLAISRRSNTQLEQLKSSLDNKNKELDAKRDYRYEALKRLYTEYEPLRFLLVEASEAARKTIGQIATLALHENENKLIEIGAIPKNNYLKVSRIYYFILPSAYYFRIQGILTHIDLESSRTTHLQYLIAKHAMLMLSQDGSMARFCKLKYTPYVDGWKQLRQDNSLVYRRQGLAKGRVENAVSAFIRSDDHQIKSFGELELDIAKIEIDDFNSPLGAVIDLFEDFDPKNRPILWRILLCQAVLHGLLITVSRHQISNINDLPTLVDSMQKDFGNHGIDKSIQSDVNGYIVNKVLPRIARFHHSGNNTIQPTAFGGGRL